MMRRLAVVFIGVAMIGAAFCYRYPTVVEDVNVWVKSRLDPRTILPEGKVMAVSRIPVIDSSGVRVIRRGNVVDLVQVLGVKLRLRDTKGEFEAPMGSVTTDRVRIYRILHEPYVAPPPTNLWQPQLAPIERYSDVKKMLNAKIAEIEAKLSSLTSTKSVEERRQLESELAEARGRLAEIE